MATTCSTRGDSPNSRARSSGSGPGWAPGDTRASLIDATVACDPVSVTGDGRIAMCPSSGRLAFRRGDSSGIASLVEGSNVATLQTSRGYGSGKTAPSLDDRGGARLSSSNEQSRAQLSSELRGLLPQRWSSSSRIRLLQPRPTATRTYIERTRRSTMRSTLRHARLVVLLRNESSWWPRCRASTARLASEYRDGSRLSVGQE